MNVSNPHRAEQAVQEGVAMQSTSEGEARCVELTFAPSH